MTLSRVRNRFIAVSMLKVLRIFASSGLWHSLMFYMLLSGAGGSAIFASAGRPPEFANIKYGPYERDSLDFWHAKSNQPTPVVIYIHGGSWTAGDKSLLPVNLLDFMLQHGVSVASINYRYTTTAPLPGPIYDAARAIQFLRWKAVDWNLLKSRFAAVGVSAGGCTTLWLAYHQDLADPANRDPVARESTRLCVAAAYIAQTSIDPKVVPGWVGSQVRGHLMIPHAVGAKDWNESDSNYPKYAALYREFSPINQVSRDAPPVILIYPTVGPLPASDPGKAIHHAIFGIKLKAKADSCGAICLLRIEDNASESTPDPKYFLLKYLTAH